MVEVKPTEPISEQEIYQAVCGAASQDPFLVRSATERLQNYETHPGTWERLHAIAAEKSSVPLDVRRMAIIQFKNGALSVWKNKKLFNKESQDCVRGRLTTFLREEDNIIADCNAIIVAKIARYDFPSQWPSLIPELSSIVQTHVDIFLSTPINSDPANTLLLRRALAVLNQTIKEFATMKMLNGVKTMAQIADVLYSPLISYYDRLSGLLKTSFTVASLIDPNLQRACEEIVELTHMIFKPCAKIMLWLWQRSGQPQFRAALDTVSAFSQSCFQLARQLFELRLDLVIGLRQATIGTSRSAVPQELPSSALKPIDILTKHIKLYSKMFRRMQQLFSRRFVDLPGANDFVLYNWTEVVKAASGSTDLIEDSFQAVYPLRLLVQGMVLFREGLNVWSGRSNPAKRIDVLSPPSIEEAVRLLMTRFIPLTPEDLEKWSTEPEEWVNEEEKDEMAWEFEIRPCGERVLLTLCTHYEGLVLPLLMGMLQHVLAAPANDLPSILQKEAVYCAIGRCASRLYEKLDFDDWLQTHLIAEAQETNPDYRIIKRRIAWVIGKWHADISRSSNRGHVWEVLRHLMQEQGAGSDPAVRLCAAEALRECVDVVNFDAEIFSPYIGDFLSQLVQLLDIVCTWEAKNRLAKTLNTVIERSGARVTPYTDLIVSTLSQLWQNTDESGEGYLFKASMIVTVTCLVEAIKEQSSAVSHIVVTLLQESFAPNARLYLVQDGLQLWLSALRNTTTLDGIGDSPGYIDMFPHAIFLVSDNLDLLGTILSIVQSYLIIDANRILSMYGGQLFGAFVSALSKVLKTNVKDIILIINLITQLAPATLWAEAMHTSGLFASLVKAVIDDKDPANVLTEHIYVFARMALSDPLIFNQLVIGAAPAVNLTETQTFEGLLDQWWLKFDCMAYPQHRKLTAMGIASWVSTGRSEVLGRLYSEIFNLWLDVFGELQEALSDISSESPDRSPLTMFWRNSLEVPSDLLPEDVENTLEAERRRVIFRQDPVNTTKLTGFVMEKLQQAEVVCGGSDIFKANYLDKTDPTVLHQLMNALTTTA